jgi:hypothetical protein
MIPLNMLEHVELIRKLKPPMRTATDVTICHGLNPIAKTIMRKRKR